MEAQKAREQDENKENVKDKKSRKFGFFVSISFKIFIRDDNPAKNSADSDFRFYCIFLHC